MESVTTVKRVLLLEDHPFERDLVVALLQDCGVEEIWTADTGETALEIACSCSVQVLICDLQTPGMDGVELIRQVSERALVEAVIIASGVSAALIHTVEEMARSSGVKVLGATAKPLTRAQLVAMFHEFDSPRTRSPQSPPPVQASLAEIEGALRDDQVVPFFQPKVSLRTRECVGVEALARWLHPTRGVVPPASFIPVIENTPLIRPLTWCIVEKSIAAWRSWGRAAWNFSVAVNCSADMLSEPGFLERVGTLATVHAVEPSKLIWEVTESVVGQDTAQLLTTLARLRLKGFGLAIDDFGTGYSSMRQLSRISFTELKIDRAFVHGASTRRHLRMILENSLDLARKLALKSVAEGVETAEDWNLLQQLGCETAQGYFIAKPMPADQLMTWHERWSRQATDGAV